MQSSLQIQRKIKAFEVKYESMFSLSFLESAGPISPRRVYKSGVGLEFIENNSILNIDALVVIFGIYGVDFPP